MFRSLMRVCCYAPSPTQPGGSFLGRPLRRKRFKNVRLPNNPGALCFSQLQDQTHIRITGQAAGLQSCIEECKGCNIFIFGDCASLMIVNCSDCFIHVASVDGSVMMRNCRSCRCSFCCRQFRAANCESCDVKLCCFTKPVIESCKQMRFGCIYRSILCIADEVGSMKVSTWSAKSTDVHDFTPDPSTRHWTCLPEDEQRRVAGTGINRQDTWFLCFMEKDAALAYAYVVAVVWKDACLIGMSKEDHVGKSLLKRFVHSLGPLVNSDERTWLRALIEAKAIVMEIEGAECISTWQHTVHQLGNEKSQFFVTKDCRFLGKSQCFHYAGGPMSEDVGGTRCQILLQKVLGSLNNEMDVNQIIETSA